MCSLHCTQNLKILLLSTNYIAWMNGIPKSLLRHFILQFHKTTEFTLYWSLSYVNMLSKKALWPDSHYIMLLRGRRTGWTITQNSFPSSSGRWLISFNTKRCTEEQSCVIYSKLPMQSQWLTFLLQSPHWDIHTCSHLPLYLGEF